MCRADAWTVSCYWATERLGRAAITTILCASLLLDRISNRRFSFSKQILMIQFQVILYLVLFQSKEFSWKQQGIKTLKSCFVRRNLGGIKRLAENIIINWRYLHYDVQSNMGIILCLGTNLWSLIFVSQDEFMNCYIQTKAFKNNFPFILLFNFRCFQNKNFSSFIQFQFFSF